MAKKIEMNEEIAWDLIRNKQKVDAVKTWVMDNRVELHTLNLLHGLVNILWPEQEMGSGNDD